GVIGFLRAYHHLVADAAAHLPEHGSPLDVRPGVSTEGRVVGVGGGDLLVGVAASVGGFRNRPDLVDLAVHSCQGFGDELYALGRVSQGDGFGELHQSFPVAGVEAHDLVPPVGGGQLRHRVDGQDFVGVPRDS